MPIYGFQCEDCGEQFEIRASIREKEVGLAPVCPKCQSTATQQKILSPAVIRRGAANDVSSSCCGPSAGSGCC